MREELNRLSVVEAVAGLRAGHFTSEQLTRDCLACVERLEDKVQAWAWLDPAQTLEKARQADRHQRAGQHLGVLHGLPIGIKDIFDTRGIPTRMGSVIFSDHVPTTTADAVMHLEKAGAFVFGKTVTAELAYFSPGKTRNPWNPAHTPGGSSMGSAAAVAAHMVPAAIGTQTNGSVIRPAAFCGVVGFKPSAGLISCMGALEFSRTLDQVGVFARSVEDAAVIAGGLLDSGFVLKPLFQPPRLAAVRTPVWARAEPAQQQQFQRDIEILRQSGVGVEEVELPILFLRAHDVHRTIMAHEGARSFADLQKMHRAQLSNELNQLIDEGKTISESSYHAALESRTRLAGALNDFLRDYDALVTPPARGEAPATLTNTGDPVFCTLWTLCGAPAITIPSGLGPQGLPLGLQIVGALHEDAGLLTVAQWCAEKIRFTHGIPA